jgi:GT2 family glycosyltransferase
MNVVVGSLFRNSSGAHIRRYMNQVQALMLTFDGTVRVLAVEGDSTDDTQQHLRDQAELRGIHLELVVCNHGGPVYGSTEATERMAALSKVGNCLLDHVRPDDDVLVYVESDLVWQAETVVKLIEQVMAERPADIIAPMVFADTAFYDIWAFRKNGKRFGPFFPYHDDAPRNGLVEMDSVGSCLVMPGSVARRIRMRNGGALVDLCADARAKGYKIAANLDMKVYHP